jgi:hypothetical protein
MYDESVLQEHNRKWPDLPASNHSFNVGASRLLGVLQLCRGVDIYNWYCREALKLALSANPKAIIDRIRPKSGRIAKSIAKAEKKLNDPAVEVMREFLEDRYRGDRIIREAIHRDLDVLQNPEVELLCTCRNVLVHKRGHDEFGELAQGIQELGSKRAILGVQWYPPGHMPVAIDKENYLIMDEAVGHWAAELLHQQIFLMDQNFAHVYKLPRKVWDCARIGRTFLGSPISPPPHSTP